MDPELAGRGRKLRDCVATVVRTPSFAGSKRYPALLQYVVEKSLTGKLDCLKERTIGIEVFQRSPNYDTSSDTVVRYTAGEVRKRLALYYHEAGLKTLFRLFCRRAATFLSSTSRRPRSPVLQRSALKSFMLL